MIATIEWNETYAASGVEFFCLKKLPSWGSKIKDLNPLRPVQR